MEKMPKVGDGEQLKINFNNEGGGVKKEKDEAMIKLRDHVMYLCNKLGISYRDLIIKETLRLIEKYPDYAQYSRYHALTAGTPPEDFINQDFPGSDSIFGFLTRKNIELEIDCAKKGIKFEKIKDSSSQKTEVKDDADKKREKREDYLYMRD